jgi:hypothetical protein
MPIKTHRAPPRYKIPDFFSSLLGLTEDQVKYRYRKIRDNLQKRIQPLKKITLAPIFGRLIYEGEQHTTVPCAYHPIGESTQAPPSNSPTSKPFAAIKPGRATRTSLDEHQRISNALLEALLVSPEREAWIRATYPLNFNQGPVDGLAVTAHKAADSSPDKYEYSVEQHETNLKCLRRYAASLRIAQLLLVPWQADWQDNGARFEPLEFPKRESRFTPWKIFKRRGRPKKPIAVKNIFINGTEQIVSVYSPAKRLDVRRLQQSREKFNGCGFVK